MFLLRFVPYERQFFFFLWNMIFVRNIFKSFFILEIQEGRKKSCFPDEIKCDGRRQISGFWRQGKQNFHGT